MFSNVKTLCSKFEGSVYEQKMKEKPEFYDWLRKLIDDYMEGFLDEEEIEIDIGMDIKDV